jgi:superoxide dismutase, Cu-Zn family
MKAVLTIMAAGLLTSGCASVNPMGSALQAPLRLADGREIGTVRLSDSRAGVRVLVSGAGLPGGVLGMHLHAVGQCVAPGFASAGAHWNPAARKHGKLNPMGAHAGDLGNVAVGADGAFRAERIVAGVRLREGATPLLDDDGAALVVHARGDDERTDPSGNSGDRIACAAFAG